jgi:uncharacterized protein YebE (UPF0316 family)
MRCIHRNNKNNSCIKRTDFSLGNLIGMLIEEKLAMGIISVRIITKKSAKKLIEKLKTKGFSITVIAGEGMESYVNVIYIVIKRQNLENVIRMIKKYNPNAFYTLEDIRFVSRDLTGKLKPERKKRYSSRIRKGK